MRTDSYIKTRIYEYNFDVKLRKLQTKLVNFLKSEVWPVSLQEIYQQLSEYSTNDIQSALLLLRDKGLASNPADQYW